MSEHVVKKSKKKPKSEDGKKRSKSEDEKPHKSKKTKTEQTSTTSSSSLAPSNAAFDPALSSLFANSLGPSKPAPASASASAPRVARPARREKTEPVEEEEDEDVDAIEETNSDDEAAGAQQIAKELDAPREGATSSRKRKRKDQHEDLEGTYMHKLAVEEAKELAKAKQDSKSSTKRQRIAENGEAGSESEQEEQDDAADSDAFVAEVDNESDDDDAASPPPQHESLAPDSTSDLAKSQRTVFLGNVSTSAMILKTAHKTLLAHLTSFFTALPAPASGQPPHKLESIRFRSTAYATAIPKKAAFAKKELMDATTKSTNAYVVYSSNLLAREAAKKLNGSVVLDRHLRVDEVAHPAQTDHKRCVFVGNLGFVDDESNIDAANEAEGREKRKGKKEPGDVEEGLWRTFAKCGAVESVRVIRDSKTRVGKGIAYVQFADQNAVEAALQYNEKRFPPLLPRKLRVTRARAVKRNAKPNSSAVRAPQHSKTKGAYNPKLTSEQQSHLGRAGKLMGRAAAAQLRTGDASGPSIRAPESFIFEGHRASSKQGKTGLKLGGGGKKKGGKPGTRSSKRGTAWKASGGRKTK